MATNSNSKSKNDKMPGFFEGGEVQVTRRPKGFDEVMKEMNQAKPKK